jgi:hypothetical protein
MILLLWLPAEQRVMLNAPDASGRWFDLRSAYGHDVVITFASRQTANEVRTIHQHLQRQPGLLVVNVVDFRTIPKVGWPLARKKMREGARANLRQLVDKDGHVARVFGVDPRHHADMFLVDKRGQLVGHFEGTQQLPDVLMRLQRRQARPR